MLRLNLLRHLPSDPAPESAKPATARAETTGTSMRALAVVLVLLLGAAGVVLWTQPGIRGHFIAPDRDARSAVDSARATLELEASRLIVEQQTDAIEWLYELAALTPAGTVITRAVFLPPGDFQLRGTVPDDAALTRIQGALVLLPGMDLRLSRADASDAGGEAHDFVFAGSLQFSREGLPDTQKRVLDGETLELALEVFLETGRAHGLEPGVAEAGTPATSAWLSAHPWRVTFRGGIEALREFINAERHRGSPFGIRRVTFETLDSETIATLDILAYTR